MGFRLVYEYHIFKEIFKGGALHTKKFHPNMTIHTSIESPCHVCTKSAVSIFIQTEIFFKIPQTQFQKAFLM
jgi:hypothetical protein